MWTLHASQRAFLDVVRECCPGNDFVLPKYRLSCGSTQLLMRLRCFARPVVGACTAVLSAAGQTRRSAQEWDAWQQAAP